MFKIKFTSFVAFIVVAALFCNTQCAFAKRANYNYKITNYTTDFIRDIGDLLKKDTKDKIKWWLEHEKKHSDYYDTIYWRDISQYPDERRRKKMMRQRMHVLFNSIDQMWYLTQKVPLLLEGILGFMNSFYNKQPSVHLIIAISPTLIDAKTQWYGEDHNTVHINAINSSFADVQNIKIILSHELFHLFQEQVLEEIGQKIKYDSVAGKLIAEGMAAYFSSLYVENAPIDKVLLFEKNSYNSVVQQKSKLMEDVIRDFDSSKKGVIMRYFGYGKSHYPPRSGYYVAYVLVKRLAEKHGFKTLTYLRPEELMRLIKKELLLIANEQ